SEPVRILSMDPDFRSPEKCRARYPRGWSQLRARILTRMSDATVGRFMYTITRTDTGQACTLLAFDAFDALLKFHGLSFTSRYQCDQLEGRLRATHKDSGICFVISSVVPYFVEANDDD
ncbi:MAG: hypothetical protein OET44_13570, partial [Gammaproteobacteria bacterium]|nr:hypothetical protein [Gammaproteobacteria bacterium]